LVRLGKARIAVKTFGVCDFSRLAVTDWRLRRWRLWFLALMTATHAGNHTEHFFQGNNSYLTLRVSQNRKFMPLRSFGVADFN